MTVYYSFIVNELILPGMWQALNNSILESHMSINLSAKPILCNKGNDNLGERELHLINKMPFVFSNGGGINLKMAFPVIIYRQAFFNGKTI